MKHNSSMPWTRGQAEGDLLAGQEMTTEVPARPAGFVSDVVVPALQSLITGSLVGALVIFLLGELGPEWEIDPFKVWMGVALAVSCLSWLVLLGQTRRLLWAVERLTGLDINQDGATGKPQERLVVVNAAAGQEVARAKEHSARTSQFAQFVAGLAVRGTALAAWEAELGRPTYVEYRDALIRLGWARWCSTKRDGRPNKKQGWELVEPAGAILERIG